MDQTLQKLADDLGLSIMSVSRALQGKAGVSEITRQRVQEAADAAGYRPNLIARALLTGRTDSIGILASDFAESTSAAVFGALELSLRRAGLQPLPRAYGADELHAPEIVSRFGARRVDGIIIIGGERTMALDFVKSAAALQIPTVSVCFGAVRPHKNNVLAGDEILCDETEIMSAATRHLLTAERKKLLLVTDGVPSPDAPLAEQFTDAHRTATASAGPHSFLFAIENRKSADAAVSELIRSDRHGFDAILATNDRLAAGAIRACQRAGLTIGRRFQDDVSLICTSDSPLCAALEPAVTAYGIAADEVARLCVERIVARIKAPTKGLPERTGVAARLIRRESA